MSKKFFPFISFLLAFASMADGQWFWQNPSPTGATLKDVYACGEDTIIAVGYNGIIIKTADGGANWTTQVTGTTLNSVHFVNINTGWAAGDSGAILKTADSGVNWTRQTSGVTGLLQSVFFIDVNNGWIAGNNGTILRTSDSGITWSQQTSGTSKDLCSIHFIDVDTGWVVGNNGTVIKTTDGGENWAQQTSNVTQNLYSLYLVNSNTGWAVGNEGVIIKTTDGGATWSQQTSWTPRPLKSVYFVNADTGWVAGEDGTVLNTTDGGDNWSPQTTGTSKHLHSIHFVSANTGWVVGVNGTILKTINGGIDWISQTSGPTGHLYSVYFVNAETGWAVGDTGTIFKTTDGGTNWLQQTTGTIVPLRSVYFVTPDTGWVVGFLGNIFKTTNAGATWIPQSTICDHLYSVHFANTNMGWASGWYGRIHKTTNGGENWTMMEIGTEDDLYGIYFVDTNTGWAVGKNGTIFKSINSGVTWTHQNSWVTNQLNSVYFIDANNGWIVGNGGTILKTTNGGTHWLQATSGITNNLYSVCFADIDNGWVVGSSGIILRTRDGGATWTKQNSCTTRDMRSVFFIDGSTGWAVGDFGTIVKTISGGLLSIHLVSPMNSFYLNNATINFIWHEVPDCLNDVDHYLLQYALDAGFSQDLVEFTSFDTIYTTTLPDTTYYWRINGLDIAGTEVALSPIWQFTIDTESPLVPSLVSPVSGTWVGDTVVTFEWTQVSKVFSALAMGKSSPIQYILEVDTMSSFGDPFLVDTLDTTSTRLTLWERFPFYWRVKAYDLAGNEGEFSTPDSFSVDTTPPSFPELISPEDGWAINDTLVTCVWHPSTDNLSGVDYYILQYTPDSGLVFGLVGTTLVETTLVDTTFMATLSDTIYYWRVRAVDKATNESKFFSSVWHFEVDTQSPSAPALISPPDSSWLDDNAIAFKWSEVSKGIDMKRGRHGERENISDLRVLRGQNQKSGESKSSPIHYILQVDTTSDFNTPIIDTTNVTYDTLTLDEYLYYWRVKAFDEAGNESDFSEPFSFTVDITSPVIDSTTELPDTVAFWGPFTVETKISDNFYIKDVVLYSALIMPYASVWTFGTMASAGDNWYTGEIPVPEQTPSDTLTIDYYITASDSADNMSRDPEEGNYSFKIFLTGIQETRNIPDRFILFSPTPNPSVGIIEIQYGLPEKTDVSLQVYDIQGRLVKPIFSGSKDAGYYKLHINSRDLSSGIYFLRFEAEGYNTTRKLLILR